MLEKTTKKNIWLIVLTIVSLVSYLAFVQVAFSIQNNNNNSSGEFIGLMPLSSGTGQSSIGNAIAPVSMQIQFLAQPPTMSPQEQQQREEILKKIHLSGPPIKEDMVPVGPSGGETHIKNLQPVLNISNVVKSNSSNGPLTTQTDFTYPLSVPGTFTLVKNSALGAAAPSKSTVNEPSVAANGNFVFYTGNWYAARSTDGGSSFSYVNPYTDMPNFCCDQDVIYDPIHGIFIWYRQDRSDANGVNYFRLGISNDNAATWTF